MSIAAQTKLQTKVDALAQEVRVMRSIIIPLVGRGREGQYHPAFVKKVLAAAKEEVAGRFTSKTKFLELIS